MKPLNCTGIATLLKNRRESLGYSLQDLEDIVDISKFTLHGYESGTIKNIPTANLYALSSALQIEPNDLAGFDTAPLPPGAFPYKPTHRIPILANISAGLPLYAEEHIEGYTYIDLNHGHEYFGLRAKDDSMTATRIYEGDILIVRKQSVVDNGDIAVVLTDGECATVRQFYRKENVVMLVPRSSNPQHQVQMFDLKKVKIDVLGLVVENKVIL